MSRIFKQPRLHQSPYIVGDEKLASLVKNSPADKGGRVVDLNELEKHVGQIMQDATAAAQKLEKEAEARGYAAGQAKGMETARAEAAGILEAAKAEAERIRAEASAEAERLRGEIAAEREAAAASLEPEIVELILKIARKVVRKEIEKDESGVVLALVREALRKVDDRGEITVRVNPADFATVQGGREDLVASMENRAPITVVQDRNVASGSCIVETGYGTVDASIDTQMEAVEKAFNDLLSLGGEGS